MLPPPQPPSAGPFRNSFLIAVQDISFVAPGENIFPGQPVAIAQIRFTWEFETGPEPWRETESAAGEHGAASSDINRIAQFS